MKELSKMTWVKILAAMLIIAIVLFFVLRGIANDNASTPEAVVWFETLQGNVTFECEVADTDAERATGLMDRESLDADAGMLFVFEQPLDATFWMKNTLIPLDIIFIDENGTVLNIEEAVPEPDVPDADLTRYSSAGQAKWVLEVNMGTSSDNGIVPGTRMTIAYPEVPAR